MSDRHPMAGHCFFRVFRTGNWLIQNIPLLLKPKKELTTYETTIFDCTAACFCRYVCRQSADFQ